MKRLFRSGNGLKWRFCLCLDHEENDSEGEEEDEDHEVGDEDDEEGDEDEDEDEDDEVGCMDEKYMIVDEDDESSRRWIRKGCWWEWVTLLVHEV